MDDCEIREERRIPSLPIHDRPCADMPHIGRASARSRAWRLVWDG